MTHGDKAKAKTGKSSQASAVKKSSSPVEEGASHGQGKGGGKVAPQSSAKGGGESGKASKISIKKGGGEKGSATPAAEKSGHPGKESAGTAKSRSRGGDDPGTFSNPAIAAAFRRAVQKYPNAFRKLTD